METFNLFNNVNFAAPSQTGTSGGNVQIFTRRGDPVQSQTVVNQTVNTSRQIQFGLKLAL